MSSGQEVDVLLECPFSEDVTSMSAEDFIRKILIEKIHARYIVIGTDFHFGHDKRGDAKMLAEYAGVYGYELFVIEKEMYGEREISSSYVREELRKGNMEAVNDMLGYAYTVTGKSRAWQSSWAENWDFRHLMYIRQRINFFHQTEFIWTV